MKLRRGRQFLLRKTSKKTSKNHFRHCIHLNDLIFDRRVEKTPNPRPNPKPNPKPNPNPNPNPNPHPSPYPNPYPNPL